MKHILANLALYTEPVAVSFIYILCSRNDKGSFQPYVNIILSDAALTIELLQNAFINLASLFNLSLKEGLITFSNKNGLRVILKIDILNHFSLKWCLSIRAIFLNFDYHFLVKLVTS